MVKINNSVKKTVVELRDNGMKWKEIANIVKDNYGIEITEGNLCNMYKRFVKKESTDYEKALNICNVFLRTRNKQETSELCNCSFYYVDKVLNNREDTMEIAHREMLKTVEEGLKNKYDFAKICDSLIYDGIAANVSAVAELVMEAERNKDKADTEEGSDSK